MVIKSKSKNTLSQAVSQIVNVRIGDIPKKKKKRKKRAIKKKASPYSGLGAGSITQLYPPRVIYATADQSQLEQQKFQTDELKTMLKLTQGELTNVKQNLLEYNPSPPVLKEDPIPTLDDEISGKSMDFSDASTMTRIPPPLPQKMNRSSSAPSVGKSSLPIPLLQPQNKPNPLTSEYSDDETIITSDSGQGIFRGKNRADFENRFLNVSLSKLKKIAKNDYDVKGITGSKVKKDMVLDKMFESALNATK
tara:strand:- start:218 stop:967 length:750 start_codon:yes stop_codon:yes gene_type:complete